LLRGRSHVSRRPDVLHDVYTLVPSSPATRAGVCALCEQEYPEETLVQPARRVSRRKNRSGRTHTHTECPAPVEVIYGWNCINGDDTLHRLHPRLTRWWTRDLLPAEVAAWTDVLIDLRATQYRRRLPADWQASETLTAAPDAEGWQVDYSTRLEEGGYGIATFLRFTAPDGFRFTLVVSKSSETTTGSAFATQKVQEVFPTMWTVFQGAGTPIAARRTGAVRETYNLNALLAAVRDPDGWFGTMIYRGDTAALQTLFSWSPLGFTRHEDCRVWTRRGLNAARYLHWRARWSETEVGLWLSVLDAEEYRLAARWAKSGWAAEDAVQWVRVMESLSDFKVREHPILLADYRDAGATAEEARDLLAMTLAEFPRRALKWAFARGLPWLAVRDPERRVAYLRAGFTLSEALGLETSPTPPDVDALHVLAAFR
jgi:hypothetical protein